MKTTLTSAWQQIATISGGATTYGVQVMSDQTGDALIWVQGLHDGSDDTARDADHTTLSPGSGLTPFRVDHRGLFAVFAKGSGGTPDIIHGKLAKTSM